MPEKALRPAADRARRDGLGFAGGRLAVPQSAAAVDSHYTPTAEKAGAVKPVIEHNADTNGGAV